MRYGSLSGYNEGPLMAANFYATPRMTGDIDLVVELREGDVGRMVALFQDDYYLDRDMVEQAIRNRTMFNMIHNALVVKVDCVVRKGSEYRREEFFRRRTVIVDGQTVTIVAPEDLILSKLEKGLFLRFYGHEFDAPTGDKILATIEQTARRDCFLPDVSGQCHGS